jgi:beta-galactosidase
LQKFGRKLVNLKKKNEVAILFSHDSNDGLNFMPFNGSGSDWSESTNNAYRNQLVAQFHKVLYQNNVGVDFVFPGKLNLENYKLVIVPSLYIASDELLQQITAYIKQGGHVIMQFKSGFCDENSMVRPLMAPGPLREACGFHYQEFSNIKSIPLKDNPFHVKDNYATDWMEFLVLETAEALAYYDHPYFSEYPAVTLNHHGSGTLLYEGSVVSDEIQTTLVKEALERAGIENPDSQFSWPLIAKSGINEDGNVIRMYYNYSSDPLEFSYPHAGGKELVAGRSVAQGDKLSVEPWDVLIVEEKAGR